MPLFSRTFGPACQRDFEDASALAGELRDLLVESRPTREAIHAQRDIVDALHDIWRHAAGNAERWNREQYEQSKEKTAHLQSTDERPKDTDESNSTTPKE